MAIVRKRERLGKDGEINVSYLACWRDMGGTRRFKSFQKQGDAKAHLIKVQGEIAQGIHVPQSISITVARAAELWLERCENRGREVTTVNGYRNHVNLHIVPALGSAKLAQLTQPAVEAFGDLMLKTRSPAMTRKIMVSLKSIIGEAQRRGLVAQNVARGVKIEMNSRQQRKLAVGIDVPTKAELQAMIAAAAEGRWRPFLITAIFSGMRASELRGLRWADVDLDRRVIHVRQRANAYGTMGMPKSRAGQREIPMSPMVFNSLREWSLACPKGSLGLVFPNGKGRVENHGNIVNRGFDAIQRRAGLVDSEGKPKYSLHALRHAAASLFIDQGFSPKRVQSMLGHSSIQMTFDVYGHLFPSLEDDHAKLAAAELSVVGG